LLVRHFYFSFVDIDNGKQRSISRVPCTNQTFDDAPQLCASCGVQDFRLPMQSRALSHLKRRHMSGLVGNTFRAAPLYLA
jgi:hypothetical protein